MGILRRFCKHGLLLEVGKQWPQCLGFEKQFHFSQGIEDDFAIIS